MNKQLTPEEIAKRREDVLQRSNLPPVPKPLPKNVRIRNGVKYFFWRDKWRVY